MSRRRTESRQLARYAAYLDRVTGLLGGHKATLIAALQLAPGEAALDVGCGTGGDVLAMERIVGPSGRAVGVDASAEMIAEAKRRAAGGGSRAEFFVCSAEALDLPAASFDAARSERVLMHVADPLRVLREIWRVLRPGGRLVCSEPDHQMSAIAADDGALADCVFRGLNALTKSRRVGRELLGLFAAAGFSEVEVTVEPLVITSLAQFWAGSVSGPEEFVEIAASLRLASEPQLRALLADWEARDARGAFFACLVGMCARGVRR